MKTYQRQNTKISYSYDYLSKLDKACVAENCRKIFIVKDETGRVHAAAYIVWDSLSAHFLIGGTDPELKTSGAMSLILWEAIRICAANTKAFELDGSMVEAIESFFRSFGAVQKEYFQITKVNSVALKIVRSFFVETGLMKSFKFKSDTN